MAARNYIDTSNEKAQFDKGARRVAKKAWMEVVVPIAQAGPPRPSPTPAQPSRPQPDSQKGNESNME
jgi:hypothetical protein